MTRFRFSMAIVSLALTACDGSPVDPTSSSSTMTSTSSSAMSSQLTPSQEAYGKTLYPILREDCAICHFDGTFVKYPQSDVPIPGHSDKSVSKAHDAVIAYVNLNAPELSRVVTRLSNDRHQCGADVECDAKATEVKEAIEQWAHLMNGGVAIEESCDAKFPQDLILLSDVPFVNSIKTLLGDWVLDGKTPPDAATKLFSQKGMIANTSLINTRLDWADQVSSSFQRRAAQASGCLKADKNCARTFIEKLAHQAFKRPVSQEEINDLMMVYESGATVSFTDGIRVAVKAILLSPSFNHRTEFGVQSNDGTFALTAHEFASALSFMLTDSLPDKTLLSAADSGALNDPAEREKQVLRLLSLASTKESVEFTLLSAWNFGNIFGKVKDPETFPQYSPRLAAQMYEETRLFLRKHLWEGGIGNVLSSRSTFVNGELADLYGIAFPGSDRNQFVEVDLVDGNRAGLITQASFLTAFSRTDETSVVARGLFVNGPLLCLPKVPPPPEEAIAVINEQLKSDATEAELADFRAKTAPCQNCHNQFDAYGLLFEQYDAIGRHRTVDEKGEPIHAGVDLSKMASFDGFVNNPVEFADLIADRPEFVQCVTRHLYAYGTGEDNIKPTQCEVTAITDNLNNGSSLSDIIQAILKSPTFSTRIAETSL